MKADEIYELLLKKAIQNNVELSGRAYDISKVWSGCKVDKCKEHLNDRRYCICKSCLNDILQRGKCDGCVFVKRNCL